MCWAALGTGLIFEVRGDSRIAAVGLYFKNNGFDLIYFFALGAAQRARFGRHAGMKALAEVF